MVISAALTAVARADHAAFGGERQMRRFDNDDESVSVDLRSCADRPRSVVTSWDGVVGDHVRPHACRVRVRRSHAGRASRRWWTGWWRRVSTSSTSTVVQSPERAADASRAGRPLQQPDQGVVSAVRVSYCRSWNTVLGAPIDPISEDEARVRFENGPWFTAVLDADSVVPRATIELQPRADVADVFRQYPDGGKHLYGDALVNDTFVFKANGVVRRITEDTSQPKVHSEDRSGVDVEPNYRPVPAFGDWEILAGGPDRTGWSRRD